MYQKPAVKIPYKRSFFSDFGQLFDERTKIGDERTKIGDESKEKVDSPTAPPRPSPESPTPALPRREGVRHILYLLPPFGVVKQWHISTQMTQMTQMTQIIADFFK